MGNGKNYKICAIVILSVYTIFSQYGVEEIDSLNATKGAYFGGTVTAKTRQATSPDSFVVKQGDNEFKTYPYSEGGIPDSVPKSHHAVEADSAGKAANSDSLGGKSAAEYTPVDTSNKYKDHTHLQNLNSTSYTHLTQTNHTDLTDGGNSSLHYHSSDRARTNHTGTQAISTVDGLQSALDSKCNLIDTMLFAWDDDLEAYLPKSLYGDSLANHLSGMNGYPLVKTGTSSLQAYDSLFIRKLNIYSGSSGASPNANSDDFVIQANHNCGLSLLSPDGYNTQFSMGTNSDNVSFAVVNDYANSYSKLGASASGFSLIFTVDGFTEAGRFKTGGTFNLSTVANAGTNPGKYLCLDASNNVDYRTDSEVLSDIGAAASSHKHDFDEIAGPAGCAYHLAYWNDQAELDTATIIVDGNDVWFGKNGTAYSTMYVETLMDMIFYNGSPSETRFYEPSSGVFSIVSAGTINITTGNYTGTDGLSIGQDGKIYAKSPLIIEDSITYPSGNFTGTLGGVSGTVQGTIYWTRIGDQVTLRIPPMSGTSNSTQMYISGLPNGLCPNGAQSLAAACNLASSATDNGNLVGDGSVSCWVQPIGGNVLQFDRNGDQYGWTASGSKGFQGGNINIVYMVY